MRYIISLRRQDGQFKSDVTGKAITGWQLFCKASSKKRALEIAHTLATKEVQAQVTDSKDGHNTLVGLV